MVKVFIHLARILVAYKFGSSYRSVIIGVKFRSCGKYLYDRASKEEELNGANTKRKHTIRENA